MSVSVSRTVINLSQSGLRGRAGVSAPATSAETLLALVEDGGASDLAVTPNGLADVTEALGVMLNRIRLMRPLKTKPYTALKVSARRWWVATFVEGGGRQDYAIHEFVNQGPSQGPVLAHCWRYNGCVAWIDGIYEEFANLTGEDVGGGTMDSLPPPIWEPVFRLGTHSAYPTGFDYVGPGHGHLTDDTSSITINGGGTNYRVPLNSPVGTLLRGTAFAIGQSFTALLPDNTTVAGVYNLGHAMVTGGVQITGSLTVSGTDIGLTTMFGAMLNGRGDMLKPEGLNAIAADREDGLEYGLSGGVATLNASLGEVSRMQLYTADRATHILESVLNGSGPVAIDGGAYGWAENDTNRDSFLQDRSEGYAKVYTHGVNKSASWLADAKVLAFNVTYRVRKGALA